MRLEKKVALIRAETAASAWRRRNSCERRRVCFITGRRKESWLAAVKEIGQNVTGVQGDVSNLDDLDRLSPKSNERKAKSTFVFANAGFAKFAIPGQDNRGALRLTFNANVKGLSLHGTEGAFRSCRMVPPSS